MIKKLGAYILIFIGATFFLANRDVMARKGDIRVFDFQYEKFEFLKGAVSLELPGKSNRNEYRMYYKVLMDKAGAWSAGHYEISVVDIRKYEGPKKEELKSKLEIRIYKTTDKRSNIPDSFAINRKAYWYGEKPIVLTTHTWWSEGMFPTPAERDERIRKDDEIFEHIVESFRYRKEDGTYAKPEIVKQPEEVKEIEFKGSEYHGN